ncbi:uncharacterized protein LOC125781304 [Astyanax mexicanus]|uniref:uncharacterized protein LOC125781304 n=1 Tax=Astyanax mexicanus TaxID=7994 RepID=UPI0020CAE258|nr:uncharacterized protein LOC125781304 [Astyanax mexicanus]
MLMQPQSEELPSFPRVRVSAAVGDWQEHRGILLTFSTPSLGEFFTVSGKALYEVAVKVKSISSLKEVREHRWQGQSFVKEKEKREKGEFCSGFVPPQLPVPFPSVSVSPRRYSFQTYKTMKCSVQMPVLPIETVAIILMISGLSKMQSASSPPLFYPFGTGAGDTVCPPADDSDSSVINLTSPFSFFGRSYPQIYINHNGFLTFDQASSSYTPIQFNSSYSGRDIIAPFWTDIDNRLNGIISYNLYTVGNVLSRATQDINQYFTGVSLSILWVFVATWDKVAYFPNSGTESSFQVVLISTGSSSFVLMNYGVIATLKSTTEVNSFKYFIKHKRK